MTSLTDKQVTCKKPHRCAWCGERILVGDKAQYRASIWEGEFQTDYMHPECYQALCSSDDLDDGFEVGAQERGKTMQESLQ